MRIRHIVTKASDDGTFEVGDHIFFEENGSISCIEAQGWIDVEDVPKAVIGMEYTKDLEYLDRHIKRLEKELSDLSQ